VPIGASENSGRTITLPSSTFSGRKWSVRSSQKVVLKKLAWISAQYTVIQKGPFWNGRQRSKTDRLRLNQVMANSNDSGISQFELTFGTPEIKTGIYTPFALSNVQEGPPKIFGFCEEVSSGFRNISIIASYSIGKFRVATCT
jgi:hypothetical protein